MALPCRGQAGESLPVFAEIPFEFPLDDEQVRRRIKAARVMSGLSVQTIGQRLGAGLQEKTLRRIESGERAIRSERELVAIAEATGQDLDFFTNDARMPPQSGEAEPDAPQAGERLDRMIEQLGVIERKIDAMIKATAPDVLRRDIAVAIEDALNRRSEGAGPPTPEADLGRVVRGDQPSDETPRDTSSDPDTDVQRGSGG